MGTASWEKKCYRMLPEDQMDTTQGQSPKYGIKGKYNYHCGCTGGEGMFVGISLTNESPAETEQGLYNGISGDASGDDLSSTLFMVAMQRTGYGSSPQYSSGYVNCLGGTYGFSRNGNSVCLSPDFSTVSTVGKVATDGQRKCGSSGRIWLR